MGIQIGQRVRVRHNHHFRGGQVGTVIRYDDDTEYCHHVVAFEKAGYGWREEVDGKEMTLVRLDEPSLEPIS